MRKKVAIIANPFSGTRSKSSLKEKLLKANNDFFDLDISFTQSAGHASDLVENAIAKGAEIIIAAGGDGTVNEVASQIMKAENNDLILGILPGGSGNGFAMHLGLGRDTVKAFDFIKEQKIKLVDTCEVNGQFFLNVSGIGFDARIAYLTKNSSSRGFKRYFLSTMSQLKNFSAKEAKITLDDEVIEGKFAAIIIANATMYGYNFTIAPTAALDDGLFDVVLMKEAPLYSYLFNSYRMLTKTIHKAPFTIVKKSSTVKIESKGENYFHIDGEGYVTNNSLKYNINSKSLKVIVA